MVHTVGLTEKVPVLAVPQTIDESFVRKRALDERDYKSLTLDNGLRVLLVSDPKSNRSAAAIDVNVGYFSDPKELSGLAHFCEHMSFLGTKKYPQEEEFSTFLAANGGSSNAYTDSEDTVYVSTSMGNATQECSFCLLWGCMSVGNSMLTDVIVCLPMLCTDCCFLVRLRCFQYFDVNADQLQPALDRFAQFFAAPLFSESATGRELNAIDSEHAKNINSDGFRLHQVGLLV
jgi:insulysin